jgi:hypothetical protein
MYGFNRPKVKIRLSRVEHSGTSGQTVVLARIGAIIRL